MKDADMKNTCTNGTACGNTNSNNTFKNLGIYL